MNENGDSFGQYCRNQSDRAVLVNGRIVVLKFRPGYYGNTGRFRLLFNPVNGKYNNKIELKIQQCKITNLLAAGEILTVLK